MCPRSLNSRAFVPDVSFPVTLKYCGRYAFVSLALLGVLAFLFAVASPADDLTQQEFLHSRKSVRSLLRSNAVRSAPMPNQCSRLLLLRRSLVSSFARYEHWPAIPRVYLWKGTRLIPQSSAHHLFVLLSGYKPRSLFSRTQENRDWEGFISLAGMTLSRSDMSRHVAGFTQP